MSGWFPGVIRAKSKRCAMVFCTVEGCGTSFCWCCGKNEKGYDHSGCDPYANQKIEFTEYTSNYDFSNSIRIHFHFLILFCRIFEFCFMTKIVLRRRNTSIALIGIGTNMTPQLARSVPPCMHYLRLPFFLKRRVLYFQLTPPHNQFILSLK